jgi:hypothetical protein
MQVLEFNPSALPALAIEWQGRDSRNLASPTEIKQLIEQSQKWRIHHENQNLG